MFPQKENEVMLNTPAKEQLGIQIGDNVVIQTPSGAFDFTVTGFCLDEMAKYNKKYEGVCAYLRPEMLDSVLQTNGKRVRPSMLSALRSEQNSSRRLRT